MSTYRWACALVVSMAACGDQDGSDGTLTVTPGRGGTVTSEDGRMTLEIPPDAVTARVDVSITPAGDLDPLEDVYPLGDAYELLPSGLEFEVPAHMEFEVAGADMADAAVTTFGTLPDGEAGTDWFFPVQIWSITDDGVAEPLDGSSFDASVGDAMTVAGDVNHFSISSAFYEGGLFSLDAISADVGQTVRPTIRAKAIWRGVSLAVTSVLFADPPGPITLAHDQMTFPVNVPPSSTGNIHVLATCGSNPADGLWGSVLTGTISGAYALAPQIPLDLTIAAAYECKAVAACEQPSTVVEQGQTVTVGTLPVVTVGGSASTGKTCGTLTNGGAQEVNNQTTMLGEIAVAVLRVTEAAMLEMTLNFSGGRGGAPDLDFFLAETTISDPRYVPSSEYVARFNGTDNPEVGTYSAAAQDYLLVVHNYVDGPATWTLDITATPP